MKLKIDQSSRGCDLVKNSMQMKDLPDVLNVTQACCLLSISDKTLYKLIREGALPAMKIGRNYRIAKLHITQLLRIPEYSA